MILRKYLVLGGIAVAGAGAFVYTQQTKKKVPACCAPGAHEAKAATPVVAAVATPTPNASVAAPAAAPTAAGSVVIPKDESALMRLLRGSTDQATRLLLARDGNARFPDSLDSGERTAAIVEALFALDRAPEGRTEATTFLEAHPDDPWAKRVRSFTALQTH
ncbi:MAG: hypothetical protein IPJ34_20045 [Myxococcales bacterium]|nr:hypothetical protein [Myxococcales bacterium]